jgi:hypothetical protein
MNKKQEAMEAFKVLAKAIDQLPMDVVGAMNPQQANRHGGASHDAVIKQAKYGLMYFMQITTEEWDNFFRYGEQRFY